MYDLDGELARLTPEPIQWRGRMWQPRLGIPKSLVDSIKELDDDDSYGYMVAVAAALLQVDRAEILALDPSDVELDRLIGAARGGATVGESSASPDSSESGEAPSLPTSDGSTD